MAHLPARRALVGTVAATALVLGAAPAYAHDGNGSAAHPWSSLADVNKPVFAPGDRVLFARGSTCVGTLAPQGSGVAGANMVVDAYGSGAQYDYSHDNDGGFALVCGTADGGRDYFGSAIPAGAPNRGAYAGAGIPSC